MTTKELYRQFIKDRRFIDNVAPKTEEAYEGAWKRLGMLLPESPKDYSKRSLLDAVVAMRGKGKLAATSCNVYIRAVNSFLHWAFENEHVSAVLKIPKQTEEKKVPSTLTDAQVRAILNWKPADVTERRIYALLVLLADTGIRINEGLTLEWDRLDFDNLLVTVYGKGRKQRILPITVECRRTLWWWKKIAPEGKWVFGTRNGSHLTYRNGLRDFEGIKEMLGIVGLRKAFHSVRHTFATNFIGSGGDAFYLQQMLGHASISTTQKYVHLATGHLSRSHEKRSLLNKKAGA